MSKLKTKLATDNILTTIRQREINFQFMPGKIQVHILLIFGLKIQNLGFNYVMKSNLFI